MSAQTPPVGFRVRFYALFLTSFPGAWTGVTGEAQRNPFPQDVRFLILFEQDGLRCLAHWPATELLIASNFQSVEAPMTAKYPEAFIEQALVKVYARGDRSVKYHKCSTGRYDHQSGCRKNSAE